MVILLNAQRLYQKIQPRPVAPKSLLLAYKRKKMSLSCTCNRQELYIALAIDRNSTHYYKLVIGTMQDKPSGLFTSCTSHIFGSILQTTLPDPLPSFNQPLGSLPLMAGKSIG